MLVELHVVDLGIVAEVDLLLGGGLTAITGETGAGKTLLVEALGLLAGERATPDLVRDGAVEARVEGRFVDPEDGDERVLCRVVPRDGRSRAYLDGRLATVSELAAVARRLMDLHGQHAHQTLLDPAVQRSALDRFAGRAALDALERHREARAAWREASERLEAMGGDAHARARELDLLRHQVREIGDAGIEGPDEDAVLEREELLLADAATHREALAAAHAAVEDTAIDAVGAAVGALDDRIPFAALATRLRSAQADLADIGDELRSAAEAVVDDPGRLEAVGQRRRMLHELRRKYGDSLAEVLAYAVQARARLEELEHHDEHAAELESVRQTCGVAVVERAAELTEARVAAAPVLAREIEARLRELAMPRAGVEIRVEPGDTTDDGADRVEILLAPNPGEPARSLARAASGGELSRAMLAVRVVLSAAPPTLIFDEVDAGIGGEAGISVGRLLATLGGDHQVLCVTHLAQVAAFADHHVVVAKQVIDTDGERTVAVADRAEEDGRVVELSRMLAGDSASETARQHAADLLGSARDARAESRGTRLPAGRS